MNRQQPYKTVLTALRLVLVGAVLFASVNLYGAKGDSKIKKGVVLKFSGFDLKTASNFSLFSKAGFLYRGNFSAPNTEKAPQTTTMTSVVTFQQGNTTFIYPYKYKVKVPIFKTPAPVQR